MCTGNEGYAIDTTTVVIPSQSCAPGEQGSIIFAGYYADGIGPNCTQLVPINTYETEICNSRGTGWNTMYSCVAAWTDWTPINDQCGITYEQTRSYRRLPGALGDFPYEDGYQETREVTNPACQLVCDPEINLIENGDFEIPTIANGSYSIIGDSSILKWLFDWVAPQTSGRLGLEIQRSIAGTSYSGNQHAELDGDHPVKIWQNISTIPGATYNLDFVYSPRATRNATDNEIIVKADGVALGSVLSTDGTGNTDTVWENQSRSFVAVDDSTTIEFVDTGTDTSFGGYLDNVGLYCIPETVYQCSDGIDNDQDSLIDYPNDPGCESTTDNDETDPTPVYQCSDGIDNDDSEDTLIDSQDPACHSDGNVLNSESYDGTINSENNGENVYQCSDGLDNDGDELIDFGNDPGCSSADDNDETDQKTEPTDVCPNIDGIQETVPEGMVLDNGSCVEEGNDGNNNDGGSSTGTMLGTRSGRVLGAETTCGIYVEKFLRKGYKGNDKVAVGKVQQFLNDYMNSGLVVDSIFGPKTETALRAFQTKHADKILTPWNLTNPTGIFYLTTQTEVNNIMCPELNLPIPTNLINFGQNPLSPKN